MNSPIKLAWKYLSNRLILALKNFNSILFADDTNLISENTDETANCDSWKIRIVVKQTYIY